MQNTQWRRDLGMVTSNWGRALGQTGRLNPPPQWREYHADLVDALWLLDQGGLDLIDGIDAQNVSLIERGVNRINAGASQYPRLSSCSG